MVVFEKMPNNHIYGWLCTSIYQCGMYERSAILFSVGHFGSGCCSVSLYHQVSLACSHNVLLLPVWNSTPRSYVIKMYDIT